MGRVYVKRRLFISKRVAPSMRMFQTTVAHLGSRNSRTPTPFVIIESTDVIGASVHIAGVYGSTLARGWISMFIHVLRHLECLLSADSNVWKFRCQLCFVLK